jgi:hypothetical protein
MPVNMRIWSLHPKYLDTKGLVALWRESLLAKKVLANKTKGYKHHPQLWRFRESANPIATINTYLAGVYEEAVSRDFHFDKNKIGSETTTGKIKLCRGQLLFEFRHLKNKLTKREKDKLAELEVIEEKKILPHPLFRLHECPREHWEKAKPDNFPR